MFSFFLFEDFNFCGLALAQNSGAWNQHNNLNWRNSYQDYVTVFYSPYIIPTGRDGYPKAQIPALKQDAQCCSTIQRTGDKKMCSDTDRNNFGVSTVQCSMAGWFAVWP